MTGTRSTRSFAALREEHRPILEAIARDAGMRPETRALLLAHLLDEEREHMDAGATASGDGARTPRLGPTVGSLRDEPPTTLVVGSLRREPR
ncbi:MAG: hypothetical protein NZ898_17115 [Myxococcota bacterium]|nr:hypothetical protein [Myxococcota bacterium]